MLDYLWKKFEKTGDINDYLRYISYKNKYGGRFNNEERLKWNSYKRDKYRRQKQNNSHFDR